MKIIYQREGGVAYFPGLSQPFELDTSALPAGQAARLEDLCDIARVFERPQPAPPASAADVFSYILIVRRGQRERTLRLHDPLDAELRALIAFIEDLRRQ